MNLPAARCPGRRCFVGAFGADHRAATATAASSLTTNSSLTPIRRCRAMNFTLREGELGPQVTHLNRRDFMDVNEDHKRILPKLEPL
jgi:hypothetical protein